MKGWWSGFTLGPALLAGMLACHPGDPTSSSAQALGRLRRGLAAEADCVAVCNGLNCAFGNVCGPPTDYLCSR